jgi:hypothetical protein
MIKSSTSALKDHNGEIVIPVFHGRSTTQPGEERGAN